MTPTAPGTSATASRLPVLLFTDMVGSNQHLGESFYSALLQRHDEIFGSSLAVIRTSSIIKHSGDGYGPAGVSTTDNREGNDVR